MAMLIALYATPADPAALDAHHFGTHVPLARSLPGLPRYRVNAGPVQSLAGGGNTCLAAPLEFESLDALNSALGSPQGLAAAADLGNFAQAGVELRICATREF